MKPVIQCRHKDGGKWRYLKAQEEGMMVHTLKRGMACRFENSRFAEAALVALRKYNKEYEFRLG